MYEGSMIGAGMNVFAVWNYIITKGRAGAIEINPKLLAFTLGGREEDVVAALEFLQKPDPQSRSKEEGGRRIIKDGQFQYRIVNWEHYQRIKNAEDKREYNRVKQAEYRAKKVVGVGWASGKYKAQERRAVKAYENGDDAGFDRIAAEGVDNVMPVPT
jgi:hypothetical protein